MRWRTKRDRQEQSERQGRRRGDEWAVGRGRASSRAFLACVWARGSGFIAVGPPPPHHPPPPHSSLLLLRQRQAKGGGGATDLAVNRRGVCSSRSVGRLHRQKPRRRKTSPHGKTADVLTRRQLNIASVRLAWLTVDIDAPCCLFSVFCQSCSLLLLLLRLNRTRV